MEETAQFAPALARAMASGKPALIELRLDPEKVALEVTASGRECYYEPSTESIIERLKSQTKSGDVIVVFSNGGFDGLHGKLIEQL